MVAQFEKIDRMPQEILQHTGRGKHASPERLAFAALKPGETLRFTGEEEELQKIRKQLDNFVRRERLKGSEAVYKVSMKKGTLYAGRIE